MIPREVVQKALEDIPDFVSAQMLHARLLLAGQRIGLTTIYRVLRELSENGKVDVIRDPGGSQLYRLRLGTLHSHYLFCRACGYSVPIKSELVERWAGSAGKSHGFVDVEHTIELIGVCADCAADNQP